MLSGLSFCSISNTRLVLTRKKWISGTFRVDVPAYLRVQTYENRDSSQVARYQTFAAMIQNTFYMCTFKTF